MLLELADATGETHEVTAQVEVRSCREADGRFLVGATIVEIDPDSRLRLMEWCYVVCSHERLRGHRPAAPPLPESEAIVVSLDDYREGTAVPPQPRAAPGLIAAAERVARLSGHPGEVSEWLKERDWKSRGRG